MPQHKPVQINAYALRKPSQVLRKAAELLEQNKRQYLSGAFAGRTGCCIQFADLHHWARTNMPANAHKVNVTISRAKEIFTDYFGYRRSPNNFWFGKEKTDLQQEKRIAALLTAAEIAEAQGE